jgi:hypothetical protein
MLIISLFFNSSQLRAAKTELLGTYPAQAHPAYKEVMKTLKAFINYKGKQRLHHFYIAEVRKERVTNALGDSWEDEHTYAYWAENDAIIILNFPLGGYDEVARRSYIDLRKQVVAKGRYANLGCCLVEDEWVRKIIDDCRKGKRVVLKKAT